MQAKTNPCTPIAAALSAKLAALEKLSEEREERNKERFHAAKETIGIALSAADKALAKAEASMERRLDQMNEFRAAMSDQSSMFMPRSEYRISHEALAEKINQAMLRLATIEADKLASVKQTDRFWGWIVGAFGIAFGISTVLITAIRFMASGQ